MAGAVAGAKSSFERIVRVSRPVSVKATKKKSAREHGSHRDGKSGKSPAVRPDRAKTTQPPIKRRTGE
jgi:hypothetical protein